MKHLPHRLLATLLLLSCFCLFSACAVLQKPDTSTSFSSSSAFEEEEAGITVHYGTPRVDGRLDAAYLDSFSYYEAPLQNLNYTKSDRATAERYMKHTSGRAYYLYDDDALYICAVVHDETIVSRGEAWRNAEKWPWNDDGAEIYLWFSDADCMAIHGDAYGIRAVMDTHIWGNNHSSSGVYRDLPRADFAATVDAIKKEYTVEMRIPFPSYVGAGSEIGTLLEIDDRWEVGAGSDAMVGALFAMPRFPGADNFKVKLSEAR